MRALMGALVLLAAAGSALGHGDAQWIGAGGYTDPVSGHSCCGVSDCGPWPAEDIEPGAGGYFIKSTGEFIPAQRVMNSIDGQYWRCHYAPSYSPAPGKTRCFFAPFLRS